MKSCLVCRGHLNLAMAVEPSTYFLSDVHGVLGQIKPETAADNSLLPEELQVLILSLPCLCVASMHPL